MDNIRLFAYFFLTITLLFPNPSSAMYGSSEEEEEFFYSGTRYIQPHPQSLIFIEGFDEVPRYYPLFSIKHSGNDLPQVCSMQHFTTSCGRYDGECRTEKGLCGETLSTSFFFKETDWEILRGHYNGNKGFDGFYKIDNQTVKFVVVEDKAGEGGELDRKTKQMSLWWQADRAETISNKYNEFNYDEFQTALLSGEVVSLYTRTLYKDTRQPVKRRNSLDIVSQFSDLSVTSSENYKYYGTAYNYPSFSTSSASPLPLISTEKYFTSYETQTPRYAFCTEVSLLGSPKWPSQFKTPYINNYKSDVHDPIFKSVIRNNGCPVTADNYCLLQDQLEEKNFGILTECNGNQIQFGSQ